MPQHLEFGLDTFGDITAGPDGALLATRTSSATSSKKPVLADGLGVDFFGVGEHHRPDFAMSAPEVVLAAIAGRTKRIQLGSAVTVLSSDDPIRVFRAFFHARRRLEWTRRGHAGARLVHRILPAVRLRSVPIRGVVRREARSVLSFGEIGHRVLARQHPPAAEKPARLSADRKRPAQNLDRRRRQPGIRRPRRALRFAAHARHHRRRSGAV